MTVIFIDGLAFGFGDGDGIDHRLPLSSEDGNRDLLVRVQKSVITVSFNSGRTID